MGSFPALHVNPPPDPTEGITRAIQLRDLLNRQQLFPMQGALQQQQLQAANLANQKQQLALKDQQIVRDAFIKNNGVVDDDMIMSAAKSGASPETLQGLQQHAIAVKQQNLALIKAQGEKALRDADLMSGSHDRLAKLSPDERAKAWPGELAGLANAGVDTSQVPQQYPGEEAFKFLGPMVKGHEQQLKDLAAEAGIQKSTAEAGQANAQTAKLKAELEFYQKRGLAPGVPLDVQEAQDWLTKNPGKGPADFMAYKAKLVPQFNFSLQNQGATGQGGQPSAMAQMVASGQAKWGDVISPRTPMAVKEAFAKEVKAINPSFNSGDFTVEQKVKEAFTSGAYSQQLNSINRAREHMQTFLSLAKDLDGSNVKAFNRLSNALSVEFGSDKVGNLNIAKQAFSSEVGKAFAGTSVGVTDRTELDKQINAASSFTQLAGAARTADQLLAGAQKALKQTYQQGVQAKPNFGENQGGGASVTAPNGKVYNFPDQASADAFKQKAGIK